jgi:ABC-type Fe3+-siderophore transport system permease subunit
MPRWKQQLGGLLFALLGGGWTVWTWYTALCEGYYFEKASIVFPTFGVMGIAMIFFQGYKEERIARGEDITGLHGMELLTPRWWAILVVSLAAGFGNILLMHFLI